MAINPGTRDFRTMLSRQGLDTAGMDDAQLAMVVNAGFRDSAPTSAAQAATIILDAVKAGKWRILVGDDARILEEVNDRLTDDPHVDAGEIQADVKDGEVTASFDAAPGATLLDLSRLQVELEDLLGVRVDVLTPADLPLRFRDQVLAEAQPV